MAGTKTSRNKTKRSTRPASRKLSKSSKKVHSSTLVRTSPRRTQSAGTVQQDSPKKKSSSLSSSKKSKTQLENSHKSSTPNTLKNLISNILETRTTKEKSRQSSNIARARSLVSGKKRKAGRPKKDINEKEKVHTIRASDNFIAQAKSCAKKEGYQGKWQTWLKAIAARHFEEQLFEA
jgi:hypothetical protein